MQHFFFLWRKCFVLISAKTCWLNQDNRVFSIKCSSAKEVHYFFSQNQNRDFLEAKYEGRLKFFFKKSSFSYRFIEDQEEKLSNICEIH